MEQYFKRFRWKPFRKKKKKKKVRFDSIPIVHIIPRLTEEEKAVESEERWQEMLNYMHDRSTVIFIPVLLLSFNSKGTWSGNFAIQ